MNIYRKKLINILMIIFFALSLTMPKMYSNIKLALLIVLFIISIVYIMKNQKIVINKKILTWYILFILFHTIWIIIGSLNSNETIALFDTFRLFVIYPFIFLVFTISLSKTNKMDILFNVIIHSNFIIAIYTILLYLNILDVINLDFLYGLSSVIGKGVHEGYTKIGAENVTSLFFTFPFVVFNRNGLLKNKKEYYNINIITSLIAILISGRRMIQLIAIISLFISFFKKDNNEIKIKNIIKRLSIILLLIIIILAMKRIITLEQFSIEVFLSRIIDSIKPDSDNIRYIQIVELLKAFVDNPIIGVGFGKGISSIVRSAERPWSYEVTYALMLYQTGLLGFTIYSLLLGFNFYLLYDIKRKCPKDKYISPLLYGYLFFLIGCFSNPLLASFDFMWTLYIIPIYYNYTSVKIPKLIKNNVK